MRKTDRFAPVYTICLYHGKEAWDGPRSLKDMMDFGLDPDQMSHYFTDYPMKLYCVNEEQDFSCFHTELRQFFTMISCQKDWKRLRSLVESEDYRNISSDTAEAIAVVLGWSDPKEIQMKYKEKGKGVNMCKALEDLLTVEREKGEKQGIEQGIEEGRARERSFLLTLIPKMTAGGDGDKIVQLENPKVLEAMQKKYGVQPVD